MAKCGRPSTFTKKLGDEICARMIEGDSLRAICLADDMPHIATVMKWKRMFPEFGEQYAHAMLERAATLADDSLYISDTATPETVQVAKLRVDTRKWHASRMDPKSYGDRLTLNHTAEELTDEQLARIAAGK